MFLLRDGDLAVIAAQLGKVLQDLQPPDESQGGAGYGEELQLAGVVHR